MQFHQRVTSVQRVRPSALRCAVLYALWASFGPAQALAQQAPAEAAPAPLASPAATDPGADAPTTLDQVKVTGIRGSIQSSIDKKRDDTVISDVLSAEDIGDLPAPSLADAIETLTGASSTRDKSGASEISIRGLGAFLSTTNFNGREITNGSGDRSVNFNMFPAELINTVAIYKTQRADLIEGGVAGTVGLETVKPLEYGKRAIQLDGRATYAEYDSKMDNADGVGWRGTASYIDQFDLGNGGKLGVSLGLQALEGTDPEEGFTGGSTWYACDGTQTNVTGNCNEVTAEQVQAGGPYYLVPSSRIYRVKEERDDRQSQFAALQWRPSDLLEVNLDYQHTDRDWSEKRSDLSLSAGRRAINDRVVGDDGVLSSYSGRTTLDSTSILYDRGEEYTGGGLNVIFRPDEAWELSTDLSYSHTLRQDTQRQARMRASARDINGRVVPGISSGNTGYVDYTYDYAGDVPSIYLNPNFDLHNWSAFGDDVRTTAEEEDNEHTIKAGRFDVAYSPADGFLTKIKGGARLTDATYTYFDNTVITDFTNASLIRQANESCRNDFPQDDFLDAADGNTIDSWATFDGACLYRTLLGTMATGVDPDALDPNNKDIDEKTRALYLMGDFSSELFGLPVTGNFGVRWVRTDVRSAGLRSDLEVIQNPDGTVSLQSTGDFQTEVIKASNDKLLPSVNAAFEFRPDLLLRLGAYRAMSRPDISALGAGRTIDVDSDESYASLAEALGGINASGNPRAKPLMSWNGDVSLEWYPNADTLLAGAVYYKQFNGGTETAVISETYTIDGQSAVVPVEQQITTDRKSSLYGFELTAAHRFSYLPAPFDGLGFKLSYNYADSDYETEDSRLGAQFDPATGEVTPGIVEPAGISGFSRNVASGSLYWELGRLDLQAIVKYRSEYYQDFVGATQQQNRYYRDSTNMDFRATYRFNKHLSMSLEAMNLSNEPRIADMPVNGSFREYVSFGRRYYLGVRYRF